MSTTTVSNNPIPQSISQRLQSLRSAITRFLLVDGLSKVLVVIVMIVLADVLLDRVFKMDLAQRGIMLVVMALIILAVMFFKLLKPLSKTVTDDALILQVEGKNKELRESVISAAQFSRGENYEQQGYSQKMVDATIKHGSQMAEKIKFGNTIDSSAFARNVMLMLVSIVGLGAIGYGVAKTEFWRTWFDRNIMLTNAQWPRSTMLEIAGIENNKMTLLRGEDHKQLVRVLPNSKKKEVDVTIEFDDGFARTTQKMRKTGTLEHTIVFRNMTNEFRFRAVGGDDTTEWVQVNLVDAPNWSKLTMTVDMPDYTGIDTYDLPPGGGPHSILEGSLLTIKGTANKKLTTAALKIGDENWPLVAGSGDDWSLEIQPGDLVGGKYTFDLTDELELRSSRPTNFSVKVKPDRAPSVRATLVGISGLVVPRARIPMSYTAGDEFSITGMKLEYSWTGQSSNSVPQTGTIELAELDPELSKLIGSSDIKSIAVTDLEPLKIPVKVSLRLAITADDNNTLSGPGTGKSREFLLRVVPEEELRADLLLREIEQRKAFELILGNQEKLTYSLQAVSDSVSETDSKMTAAEAIDSLRDVQRRQKQIGTNVSRIADRFQSFLAEAINNRLDEAENDMDTGQSYEERFAKQIITPIRELDGNQVIRAGQLIELAQRTIAPEGINKDTLNSAIADAINKQNDIIEKMQEILASMKDSETYQEIVNKVIEIKRTEERIRDRAREKKDEIGSGGIFDDVDEGDGLFDDEDMPAEDSDDKKEKDKKAKDKKADDG